MVPVLLILLCVAGVGACWEGGLGPQEKSSPLVSPFPMMNEMWGLASLLSFHGVLTESKTNERDQESKTKQRQNGKESTREKD